MKTNRRARALHGPLIASILLAEGAILGAVFLGPRLWPGSGLAGLWAVVAIAIAGAVALSLVEANRTNDRRIKLPALVAGATALALVAFWAVGAHTLRSSAALFLGLMLADIAASIWFRKHLRGQDHRPTIPVEDVGNSD